MAVPCSWAFLSLAIRTYNHSPFSLIPCSPKQTNVQSIPLPKKKNALIKDTRHFMHLLICIAHCKLVKCHQGLLYYISLLWLKLQLDAWNQRMKRTHKQYNDPALNPVCCWQGALNSHTRKTQQPYTTPCQWSSDFLISKEKENNYKKQHLVEI